MSTPPPPAPAPQGAAPTWSSPSGGAISSTEPETPTSGGVTSSSPAPAHGNSSVASSSPSPPAAPPPQTPPPPGCAACKHKRQKCAPDCILAPYFPAGDPEKFRSVLRVFGVKNLLRTLREEVPRPRWDACVRTVVHESRMRLADPVRGCVGAVEDLEAQLLDTAVELEVLRRRLEAYRQAAWLGAGGGIPIFQPPNNPSHGIAAAAAASPWGVISDLGAAAWQQPGTGRARGEVMKMQPQGPYGAAWSPSPAMAGLAATQPQLSGTPPPQLFYAVQPQLSATPPQLPAMQPQAAMRRQAATRGAAAMIHDGFGDARGQTMAASGATPMVCDRGSPRES